MREDTLRDERFEVRVSFDERRGYVAHQRAADHHCVVARRRINERLIGEGLDVKLVLDCAARFNPGLKPSQFTPARALPDSSGNA
jgi:hypothetical protein